MSGVARRSLADELAAAVVDLVQQQGLSAGSQLDTVRALATRFGVAVPTMREALRRLEAVGIVVLRHGSGVYVGDNLARTVMPNLLGRTPSAEQLIDLLDARRVLEPPIAELAARTRAPDGVERLRSTLAEAEDCLAGTAADRERLWMINLDFHRALSLASGNTVLGEVVDAIVLVHAAEQREILRIHGNVSVDFDEHRAIADAVLAGDGPVAYELTRVHLTNVIDAIRANDESTTTTSTTSKRTPRGNR